jgi:hypothetical protein
MPILGTVASQFSGKSFGAYESIATITSSSGFTEADFTSIPQGYKHLQLRYIVGGQISITDIDYLFIEINGLTNLYVRNDWGQGPYNSQNSTLATGQPQATAGYNVIYNGGDNQLANMFGVGILDFHDYSNSSKKIVMRGMEGTTMNGEMSAVRNRFTATLNNNSAQAINRIRLYPQTTGRNFKPYSHFALYGIKG